MATKTKNKVILPGEGTDQQQRLIDALNPDSLNLNDFSVADWMKFAWNFAEKVNYFNYSNQKEGNWQDFFVEESQIKSLLAGLETNQSLNPHLTLFVCFLKLLDFSKDHFNQLTRRHLDFYYGEILKIEKQAPVPDQVHIIFELAKNIPQEKIKSGTSLDAGKDSLGNKLVYKTQEELVANKTTIAQLKNVYHHSEAGLKGIKACDVANSFDGLGTPSPSGNLKWYPFGYLQNKYTDDVPELPDARVGFAVASPVLLLNEGLRTIRLKMIFKNSYTAQLATQAETCLSVYLSGKKKWLGPFKIKTSGQQKELNFELVLDKSVDPVVAYNQAVLGEHLTTTDPVMRFLIDLKTPEGYAFFTSFSGLNLKSTDLKITVEGMTGIELENDLGTLNAKKPFMPFGPVPLKNSRFTLKNQEVFGKDWESLKLKINWMNTPDSFKSQYFAYRTDYLNESTADKYRSGIKYKIHKPTELDSAASNLIVQNDSYFKASVAVFSKNEWTSVPNNLVLFTKAGDGYQCTLDVINNHYNTGNNGQLQLSLNQTFLHEMYPRIYTLALLNDHSTLIPKEPYLPLVESIEFGYSANANATFNPNANDLLPEQTLQLFHEHPFGQNEKPAGYIPDSKICLLPEYQPGGELYIGLKDAEPLQQVSLLFQVFEGSENPDAVTFATGEKMEWSILCADQWMTLNSNYLISNNTDNFLKSGIVRFSIPPETTNNNNLLTLGLHWIRVRMNKTYDAVCKIIDIRAQAVLAQFEEHNNELSHLKNGIQVGTISKLSERKQSVKSVSQPFNSFGGQAAETGLAYYQRISERLRHKNRAITLWDYEHLILQQFPEIHKVRCLNHTSESSFLSPGNVTLVVIPDILNKNVFDIYQPRVSRATLNKVQNYISQLNSLHVNAVVINPEYEEVEISLKVRFNSGYDENYYQKVLQQDLTRLLSPWAFEKTIDLQFGATLHQSIVISYIEKLPYIDHITDLKIKHKGEIKTSVTPSGPKAILVSVKEHPISILSTGCAK